MRCTRSFRWFLGGWLVVILSAGCADVGAAHPDGARGTDAGPRTDAASPDAERPVDAPVPTVDAGPCLPPDVLLVVSRVARLARSTTDNSMPPNTPDGQRQTRWFALMDVVERLAAAYDGRMRLGLELFPVEETADTCLTLPDVLAGFWPHDLTLCASGEVAVVPALGTSGAIDGALSLDGTRLCQTAPIASALDTAAEVLRAQREPGRRQIVVLVVASLDTCQPLGWQRATHALARDGVEVYAIAYDALSGEGGGVGHEQLNDIACAGRTAIDFATRCVDNGFGDFIARERSGPALYPMTIDPVELEADLEHALTEVCCDCP